MSKVPCAECGMLIMESTYEKNDGVCMLCKRGAIVCADCGARTFASSRGMVKGGLCLACFVARENKKPSEIDTFIKRQGKRDCSLLRALFRFEERLRREGNSGIPGLNLIDPPQHYGNLGTILYDPRTTPKNTIAFAHSGGDDVHFSLVSDRRGVGDGSPVVMTVPMGSKVEERNIILGANLHEFLCLGCEQGYFNLEQLYYDRNGTIAGLAGKEDDDDPDEQATLAALRQEMNLKPWSNIAARLDELDRQYKTTLKFKRTWFGRRR